MSKWIEFMPEPLASGKKTKRWAVSAKEGGDRLGSIQWYGPWRQYTFQPAANTIYERQCLRDLADFCELQTKTHRKSATD
jgi:hypothetical protein